MDIYFNRIYHKPVPEYIIYWVYKTYITQFQLNK